MPPKTALKSDKNSTVPRRGRSVNEKDAKEVNEIPQKSKDNQQKKVCDDTLVVERQSVRITRQKSKNNHQGKVCDNRGDDTVVIGENSKSVVPSQNAVVSKPKRTRHRKQVKSSWTREITKTNREHGKAYQGYQMTDKGVVHGIDRSERKLGTRCSSNYCLRSKKRNCHDVDESKRADLFEKFWNDLNWDQKKIYIASLVDVDDADTKDSGDTHRTEKKYFLKVNNKRIQVCKPFFLSTFGLNEWMVGNWAINNNDGIITAKAIINARRKADRLPSEHFIAVQEKKDFLLQYFNELPKMPSHYCRARTDKQYIEPNFQSLSQLYEYYKIRCNESNGIVNDSNGVPVAVGSKNACFSYGYFCEIFKDLKLSLYQPRKDRCDTCVANEKGNITAEEYNDHILQKNLAQAEKKKDKDKAIAGEAHVFVWDVQAVKLAPANKSGILYYKTKLKNHNFTIYNLRNKYCMCNWWHEGEGGMDSPMFVTCATDFLEENCNDDLPIIVWSDGCGYQNRNQILSNALLDYSVQNKKTVQQKFLVKGHTQMEVDNVHALIERKLKNKDINVPSDYVEITKQSRLTVPLEARMLHHGDFRNYSDPRLFLYNSIRPGKLVGDDTVQDLRMLQYDPNGTISFKVDFRDDLKPLPRNPKKPIISYEKIEPLYQEELKISAKRYSDLQDLKVVLSSEAHEFYDNLKHE